MEASSCGAGPGNALPGPLRLPKIRQGRATHPRVYSRGSSLNSMIGTAPTQRQLEVLEFIQSQAIPPTLREIADHFGIASKNGVACHIVALKRKGLLTYEPHKERTLRSTRPAPRGRLAFRGVLDSSTGRVAWKGSR